MLDSDSEEENHKENNELMSCAFKKKKKIPLQIFPINSKAWKAWFISIYTFIIFYFLLNIGLLTILKPTRPSTFGAF